jgi:hypothetical protein
MNSKVTAIVNNTKNYPEGKFLVGDQPHSKLITFSYLFWREFFSRNF